jgi:hypothetical protein
LTAALAPFAEADRAARESGQARGNILYTRLLLDDDYDLDDDSLDPDKEVTARRPAPNSTFGTHQEAYDVMQFVAEF